MSSLAISNLYFLCLRQRCLALESRGHLIYLKIVNPTWSPTWPATSPANLAQKVNSSNLAMCSSKAMLKETLHLPFFYKEACDPALPLFNTNHFCRSMHSTEACLPYKQAPRHPQPHQPFLQGYVLYRNMPSTTPYITERPQVFHMRAYKTVPWDPLK